ncbi:putative ankyrin repeat protein [Colletotrichum fructicola]|nr:putative ankyrin repeat protein [Colletotrichum fructicola]
MLVTVSNFRDVCFDLEGPVFANPRCHTSVYSRLNAICLRRLRTQPEKGNDAVEDDVALSYLQLKSSHSPGESQGGSDIINIVHVTCFRPEVQMFSREHLLSDKLTGIETRELVFQVGIDDLLVGEMVQECVEDQAKCLLRGLLAIRADTSNKSRTIIFVAFPSMYPDIFFDTRRIVFSGCPQRGVNESELAAKLGSFLVDQSNEKAMFSIISTSIRSLAACIFRTNQLFSMSKISLRCLIISLHAPSEKQETLHHTLDEFTATMGLPSEVIIQETVRVLSKKELPMEWRFCNLSRTISKHFLVSSLPAPWAATEKFLRSISAHPRQLRPRSQDEDTHGLGPKIESSPSYREWTSSIGNKIIYVHGDSTTTTHDVADYIFASHVKNLRESETFSPNRAYMYTFDSRDPLHDSIPSLVAGMLLQSVVSRGCRRDECQQLQEPFLMQAGWGDNSCQVALETLKMTCLCQGLVLLLHDFDECNSDSGRRFLEYYGGMVEKTEHEFKLIITSRKPDILLSELAAWPKLNVDELPSNATTPIIRVVHKSDPSKDIKWVLSWLLCSYRPLNVQEFVFVCNKRRPYEPSDEENIGSHWVSVDLTSSLPIWLISVLRIFVDTEKEPVEIRGDVRNLLEHDPGAEECIWDEVRSTAHYTLFEFCANYLTAKHTVEKLEVVLKNYNTLWQTNQQGKKPAAPLDCDNNDIVYYAIQALPYHMSKLRDSATALKRFCAHGGGRASTVWAKLYWAMSSLRTSNPPASAQGVLGGLGLTPFAEVREEAIEVRAEYALMKILQGRGGEIWLLLDEGQFSLFALEDILATSIQAGEEETARKAAKSITLDPNWRAKAFSSMEKAIWAATWLGMSALMDDLLHAGISPNLTSMPHEAADSTLRHPSLIYMATSRGHIDVVRSLMNHGAKIDVIGPGQEDNLLAAAFSGHLDLIRLFSSPADSPTMLHRKRSGLFVAAERGHWRAVSLLIQLGADPNSSRGSPSDDYREWSPLAIACRNQWPKTMEALLQGGADPNILGPYGVDTPLWFCTVDEPNLQCVRCLVQFGADPNHNNFSPPLLHEMAKSAHKVNILIDICDILLSGKSAININAAAADGETALMQACRTGKMPLVRWLLTKNANINSVNDSGQDAMKCAIWHGRLDIVAELLKHNPEGCQLVPAATDDPVNTFGPFTYLTLAAHSGRTEIVELLMANGLDVNQADGWQMSPVRYAIDRSKLVSDTRLFRQLIENGAKLGDAVHGESLLHRAIDAPLDYLKVLLEFRRDIDIDVLGFSKATAFHYASSCSRMDHMRILTRAGADINIANGQGYTALHDAAYRNDLDVTSFILAQPEVKVNITAPSYGTALHMACKRLNIEVIRSLISHGADTNAIAFNYANGTPLMSTMLSNEDAVRDRDAQKVDMVVRMLVSNKADIQQTMCGSAFTFDTAFQGACFNAGVATINFLLDEGASVQHSDALGRLPLHFAAANGIENFLAVMLTYRGDMMATDKEGKTCLHWAAQFGNLQTVKFIIDRLRGADVDCKDSDGWTPLCWAARGSKPADFGKMRSEKPDFLNVICTLLRHGASSEIVCNLSDDEGTGTIQKTALDLARLCGSGVEITSALEPKVGSSGSETAASNRRYVLQRHICHACLVTITGPLFGCKTCNALAFCNKCVQHFETYHSSETQKDGKLHVAEKSTVDIYRNATLDVDLNADHATKTSTSAQDGLQEQSENGEMSEEYDSSLDLDFDLDGLGENLS